MILILLSLLFSNISFGATQGVAESSRSCISLILKAGLMTEGELTPESATAQYLQYLKYFFDQGSLSLEDLKVIRKFSKVPNFIQIYAHKIPESFVYVDHVEKLLSYINHDRFNCELDDIIAKESKILALKDGAMDETQIVWGAFAAPKAFGIGSDTSNRVEYFMDDALGLISFDEKGTLRHLETGTNDKFELKRPPTGTTTLQKVKGQNYIVTTTHYDSNGKVNHNTDEIFVVAYEVKTGLPVVDVILPANILPKLYLNVQGHFGVMGVGGEIGAYGKWYIFTGTGNENLNAVETIPMTRLRGATLTHITSEGEAYVLLRHLAENGHTDELTLYSVSNGVKYSATTGVKKIFTIECPNVSDGSYHDIKERQFHKNKDGSFTILFRQAAYISDVTIAYSPTAKAWEASVFRYETPVERRFDVKYLPESDGSYRYLLSGEDEPLLIFKNGVKTAETVENVGLVRSIIPTADRDPYILAWDFSGLKNSYYLFKLGSSEIHRVIIPPELIKDATEHGARLTPDGRILKFFSKTELFHNGLKSIYMPIQLYGPFDPKTGQAAP
jgi:hypothetical protein